ncbi:G-protein coupled receptor moody-like [Apostichopus japonicus]|uniref:G-protein coupled receptor moody-like n=1 Tax=Stichopus japonicus TaxID=307972 RepID=UPI003AB64CE5
MAHQSTNFSMDNFRIDGMEIPYNHAAKVLIYSNYVVAALGIPGNTLVILAVVLSKRVRNISTAFIVNLAIADLLTCCVAPIFSWVQGYDYYDPILEPVCQAVLVVVHSCIGASMYTLAAIAVNRFLVIISSRQLYEEIYQSKYVAVQIVVIWIIPISVAVLPSFVFGIGQQGYDFVLHTCAPVKDHPTTVVFNDILTFVLYPIPLTTIIFCYIGILVRVIIHNRKLAEHGVTRTSGNPSNENTQTRHEMETENTGRKKSSSVRFTTIEIQITKNLFIIFLAYILCLTPQSACTFFSCRIDENYTRHVVLYNSVVNPVIYGLKHPLFRQVFVCILRCRRVPEPSSFLTALMRRFERY